MKLEEFLVKAKINTYAGNGEGNERKLDDGSKELRYKKGKWRYRDRYFGFNPFGGEEIVLQDGKIIWLMNYHGRIVSKNVLTEDVYVFLKKALSLVRKNKPFRGPDKFQEGAWRYSNRNSGSIYHFFGTEHIYFHAKKIYELKYHGGKIL
ncbi:MAG: DUF5680 domain-containing protein [bacterium]|nr:DUF5680 domain-containing protein [bacterium]